ncbi:MAG TPA: hypothetical protein VEV84_10145 [Pyrinomonadaceae bacterium]|nr:hypothetical protein [Pyrinomonadaceae bacterium]
MSERLSSVLVPIIKLFPIIPVVGVIIDLPDLFKAGITMQVLSGCFFLFVWGTFFYLVTRRWRVVYLRGGTLFIYRLGKVISIPISEVRSVEASPW